MEEIEREADGDGGGINREVERLAVGLGANLLSFGAIQRLLAR